MCVGGGGGWDGVSTFHPLAITSITSGVPPNCKSAQINMHKLMEPLNVGLSYGLCDNETEKKKKKKVLFNQNVYLPQFEEEKHASIICTVQQFSFLSDL